MKTLELFRSNSSTRLQLIKRGALGVCALLSIAALIISFKPKPPTPAPGCYRPTFYLNNHCLEGLKANFEYYNCAGSLHEVDGIDVPASTQWMYTLPADSQHIHWVKLICPDGTNWTMTANINSSCSTTPVTTSSCNGYSYCVVWTCSGPSPFYLDGQSLSVSYGPC